MKIGHLVVSEVSDHGDSNFLILSRVRVTLDGVLDWSLDLLTALTHDS
jgi:hypothetical protein